jgi:hypothetical protein
MLLRFPILRQPDHSKPFYIYTDASGYALGDILSQFDDESNEYVYQYASRLLKGAEISKTISLICPRRLFLCHNGPQCASMASVNMRSLGEISTLGYLSAII